MPSANANGTGTSHPDTSSNLDLIHHTNIISTHTIPAVSMANIIRRMLRVPVPEASSTASDTTTPSSSAPSSSLHPSSRYLGYGQLVCVADTGFDTGSKTDVHQAFTGRVKALHAWGPNGTTGDPHGHGTYISGYGANTQLSFYASRLIIRDNRCVLGRGQHKLKGRVDGTAPAASLMVQALFTKCNEQGQTVIQCPSDLGLIFNEAYTAGARIHNNSWGTPLSANNFKQHPYDTAAESIDRFLWAHQDMTVLFAAGNDGRDANGHVNERSIISHATAKNCITVGASERLCLTLSSGYGLFRHKSLSDNRQANNAGQLAAFSSRGPTADDRIKPDVVAPGTAILSARSRSQRPANGVDYASSLGDEDYQYNSGTSASAALVAGFCAVIREALLANGYRDVATVAPRDSGHGPSPAPAAPNPTASLIKALLINGAVPVEVHHVPNHQGLEPNPHSGYVSYILCCVNKRQDKVQC
jgi:subtilisin family serine protease